MVKKLNITSTTPGSKFKAAKQKLAEKKIKEAFLDNSGLEALTTKYCAENNITDVQVQNDLNLLARFYNVDTRLIDVSEGFYSHTSNLVKAAQNKGVYINPIDRFTLNTHAYILRNNNYK